MAEISGAKESDEVSIQTEGGQIIGYLYDDGMNGDERKIMARQVNRLHQ